MIFSGNLDLSAQLFPNLSWSIEANTEGFRESAHADGESTALYHKRSKTNGINFLGIDPGKSGAFALLDFYGKIIALHDMPPDLVQTVSLVELLLEHGSVRGAIEKPFVGDKMGKPSILSFGQCIGDLRGVLAAFKIPFTMVKPQDWQKPFGVVGKSKGLNSIRQCLKLYPDAPLIVDGKEFDGRSDALLIARWLWRQELERS